MLNKNLDEWLYLTGMENALDELEKSDKISKTRMA